MRPSAFRLPHRSSLWLVNGGIALVLRALVPYTLEAGGERYRYYAMSQLFPIEGCPSFHCFRVLPPLFASLLPFEVADAFIATGWIFQVLAAIVLFHLAVKLNGSRRVAWLTVAWYWATWAPILAFNEPLLITDPVQAFWSFTALYLLLDRRHATAALMLVAGGAVKESVLLIPLIYGAYVLLAGERMRPSIARLTVLALLPIGSFVLLRYFLHSRFGYVISEDTPYVRQTYFFGVWLKNLGPWPLNLRLAALYIFGSFGAGWILGAIGLMRADRRQRALAAASIPAMIVLALLQVPDRALASFPYAVLIPAASVTALLPAPLAWSLLLVNAAFTIRMNTTVSWLPRTPVLLVVLLLLTAIAAWAARRARRPHDGGRAERSTLVPRLARGALAVTAMLIVATFWHGLTSTPAVRLALPTETTAIADDDAGTPAVAAAPDGLRVAFVGFDPSHGARLFVRSLTAAAEHVIDGTQGASAPFWSPDGTKIGFFAAGQLKIITLETGSVGVLAIAPHPRGGAWSRRGAVLYAPEATGGLYEVSERGGPPRAVTSTDPASPATSHRWPSFLPDGTRFLFAVATPNRPSTSVYLGSLDSPTFKRVIDDGKTPSYRHGLLLFGRDERFWAQPFDTRREAALGSAMMIAPHVATSAPFGRASASFSANVAVLGTDTARSALVSPQTQLHWFDRTGHRIVDGTRPLFAALTGRDWPLAIADPAWQRVMKMGGVWSADGERFAYAETIGQRPTWRTVVKDESPTGGEPRTLGDVRVLAGLSSWSPDGSTLLFHAEPEDGPGSWDVFALSLASGQSTRLLGSPANEFQAQFSPDGKWIAYTSDETGRSEIFVEPYPLTGAKWQVSAEGGAQPRWRGDGNELFFIVDERVLAASAVQRTPAFRAGIPQELFRVSLPAPKGARIAMDYAVTPDGEHVMVSVPVGDPPTAQVAVWLNWRRGLHP